MPKNYYKRENGRYYGRKVINGVEHTTPLETASSSVARERAQEWVARLIKEKRGEVAAAKRDISFDDAVQIYTDTHFPRIKASTRERYLHSLMLLTEHFSGTMMGSIGSAELVRFETERRKPPINRKRGGRGHNGADNATIRRDLQTLSGVFEICIESELLDNNPVRPFLKRAKRRGLTENQPRDRILSHVEEHDIILACRQAGRIRIHTAIMLAAFVVLSIDLGLRDDELLTLTWDRVNLDRNEVHIPKHLAKRDSSARYVPILPRSQRLLRLLPRHPHSDLVIHHQLTGDGYSSFWPQLQKAATFAGITEHITIHDLRRTCGVRLLRDHRLSMEQVSKWLGHSSVKVTERVYAFLTVDDLHAAVGTGGDVARPPEIEAETVVTKLVPNQRLIGKIEPNQSG